MILAAFIEGELPPPDIHSNWNISLTTHYSRLFRHGKILPLNILEQMKEVVQKDIVCTLQNNNNREDNYMAIMQTMVLYGYYKIVDDIKNMDPDYNKDNESECTLI